jgi:hypothetical protein
MEAGLFFPGRDETQCYTSQLINYDERESYGYERATIIVGNIYFGRIISGGW